MKALLFICYTLVVTISVTKQQELCSPEGSIRLRPNGNATNAAFGIVEICTNCVDMPCRWLTICSDGWSKARARYTCNIAEPAYTEGIAIETVYEVEPMALSLNISACPNVDYQNCGDVPEPMCTKIAGVICTEREIPCETPTTPTPQPTCPDPCIVTVIILGVLAGLLLLLLVAVVIGWLCTCAMKGKDRPEK